MTAQTRRWQIAAVAGLVLIAAIVALVVFRRGPTQGQRLVGVTQIATHPSLDEVREGAIEELARRGYKDGEGIRVIYRNANGDPSLALPIAQDFVQRRAALIIPITTPSALAAAKATNSIPIVFGGVTDPVGVGLVKSLEKPGGNATGTSDRWPFAEQFQFFKDLMPSMRRLAMPYRPGDDVSQLAIEAARRQLPQLGVELVLYPVSDPSQVYPAAVSALRETDAVYTGIDNLVAENLDSILKAAREARKPVFAGDMESVRRGASAALAIGMRDLGRETGAIAAAVLDGRSPGEIPVYTVTSGTRVVNRDAIATLGLNEETLKSRAIQIIEPARGGP